MLYLIVTSAEEKNAEASPAMVEHAPAPAVAEKYRFDPPRVWEQEACDGVITCYQAADVVGLVAGRVTMELDSEGGVERVELRIPDTTDAIRNCVRQVAQGKQLPDYNGLPATLRCDFAGVVSGEATSVERVGHYTPHTEE